MIALDADTIESLVGRVNITGQSKKTDTEVITKPALTALSVGLSAVQNAFYQIKAGVSNISRLENAKFTSAKNIALENAAEALYSGPQGEASSDSTSSALLDALPDITKMLTKLGKDFKKVDLSPQPVPIDTGGIADTAISATPAGRGMKALKIGGGALAAGIIGYGAYEALTPDEPPAPTQPIPVGPARPAGSSKAPVQASSGNTQNIQARQQRAARKSESVLTRAIRPLAMFSPLGLGAAAGAAALLKPSATGKSWTDKLTGFIGDSINTIEGWLSSFGSWLKSGAESAAGIVNAGIETAGDFGSGVQMALGAADAPYEFIQNSIGASPQEWDVFRNTVAQIESGGKYDLAGGSSKHYDGRYQMGKAAKAEAARVLKINLPHDPQSRQAFRSNPGLQEKAFAAYTAVNHQYLSKNPKYAKADIKRKLQILGYAHNQGAGGANKWLNTGKVGADAFGTAGTKYVDAIAGNFKSGGMASGSAVGGAITRTAKGVMGMTADVAKSAVQAMGVTGDNGRLPSSMLATISGGFKALPPAAAAIKALLAAANRDGIKLSLSSAYRSYEDQVRMYRTKPKGMAARPGRSNHGWGLAFDISGLRNPQAMKWMQANAPRFGIFGPLAKPYEHWHWEYRGGGSTAAATQPVPDPNKPKAVPVGSPKMRTPAGPVQTAAIQKKKDARGNQQTTVVVQGGGSKSNTPGYVAPKTPPKSTKKNGNPVRDFFKHYFNAA